MNINLYTAICPTGYGVAGFNLLRSLLRRYHDVALFPMHPMQYAWEHSAWIQQALRRALTYDAAAPAVRMDAADSLALFPGKGMRVGFTFYEFDMLHAVEIHQMNCLDLLCVSSAWAREVALANGVVTPIAVVPLGVDRQIFHEQLVQPEHSNTVFFHVGKYERRKGQDFLLQAFNKAFLPTDEVLLQMCSRNVFQNDKHYNEDWVNSFQTSRLGLAGRIQCVDRFDTQQQVAAFMAAGDCGVFPARAEGWNLELLEAMALGKTVIATAYSGHTEFLTQDNALSITVDQLETIDWRRTIVTGGVIEGRGAWAQLGADQLEQLIVHLREVHRRKQAGELVPNHSGITTAQRLSWERTASILVSQLR